MVVGATVAIVTAGIGYAVAVTAAVQKSHQHANTTLRSKEYSPSSEPHTLIPPLHPVLSIDQLATSTSTTLEA
jgi:ribosomal protein S5